MTTSRDIEQYLGGSRSPALRRGAIRRTSKDIRKLDERNARAIIQQQYDLELHEEKSRNIARTAYRDAELIGALGDQIRQDVNGDEYQARLRAPFLNEAFEAVRQDFRDTVYRNRG